MVKLKGGIHDFVGLFLMFLLLLLFQFEIAPEEGTEQVFRGSTPTECHVQLLEAINAAV